MTLDELKNFDGKTCSDDPNCKSVYVAVNGKIFDVTEKGMEFYGPGKGLGS